MADLGVPDWDPVTAATRRAWSAVLDPALSPDDEPFDMAGGDSLAFLRLIHMIEEELRVTIPLDHVSMTHTSRELADAIRAASAPVCAETPPSARRRKVFMVPVAGGDGPGQARFRAGCATDLEIEMLQLPHWSRLFEPTFSFDSVCDHVIAQIKEKAPDGPILLAGYCFGGAVASVSARRLLREGREVAFLGLLDGDVSWFRRAPELNGVTVSGLEKLKSIRWAWQQGRLTEHLARLTAEATGRRARFLLRVLARNGRYRRLPERFGFFLNLYLQMFLLPRFDRPGLIQAMADTDQAPIPTMVFRTAHHDPSRPNDLGWSELFRPVRVAVVGGDHDGLFDPSVIAGLCRTFISAVEQCVGQGFPGRNPAATT